MLLGCFIRVLISWGLYWGNFMYGNYLIASTTTAASLLVVVLGSCCGKLASPKPSALSLQRDKQKRRNRLAELQNVQAAWLPKRWRFHRPLPINPNRS